MTPIPYKLVTIASGVAHFDLLAFIGASIVSRSLRFFPGRGGLILESTSSRRSALRRSSVSLLVLAHQPAVARDIGGEDGGGSISLASLTGDHLCSSSWWRISVATRLEYPRRPRRNPSRGDGAHVSTRAATLHRPVVERGLLGLDNRLRGP